MKANTSRSTQTLASHEDLADAARSGDENAFASLIDSYWDRIARFMGNRLDDPAAADDATQEVFILAFLHIRELEQPIRFTAWLLAIARRTAWKWATKQKLEKLRFVGGAQELGEIANQEVSEKETAEIRNSVLHLPEADRSAVVLSYFLGLRHETIGRLLGVPVGTVKSRLHRARKTLRRKGVMKGQNEHDRGREVIEGMRGVIRWDDMLANEELSGWRTDQPEYWRREGRAILGEARDDDGGFIEFGDSDWDDFELSVLVTPIAGGNVQVVFRRSSLGERYYLFDMLLGWQAIAISRHDDDGELRKLSVVNFPIALGHEYRVLIAARGESLTTYVDGECVNQLTDGDLRRGKLALNVWQSVTAFHDPRIRSLT
jgi:RNA polymerase sigma-70 factor (ECF subfamily)